MAYIASFFQDFGEVEIWNQDLHHYSDEALTDYLDENKFDFVGLSFVSGYNSYKKLLSLSNAINRSKQRPTFVLGGSLASPYPEYFLKKTGADVVVVGEGEGTIYDIAMGKTGIIKQDELINDLDIIPLPAYDLFPIEYYRLLRQPNCNSSDFVMPILSSRGCTFKCSFCYRMDKGFRPRSVEGIVEEINLLKKDYGINYIWFADELLMNSVQRTEEISRALGKLDIKWSCSGRLNYAKPDLLKLMKQSGCVFIGYGVECFDNTVLKNIHKSLTEEQIIKGINATLGAGITPGMFVMWGNIGDNLDTLEKTVNFILNHSDGKQMRTIRPVTPYPGSPLFDYCIENGYLKDVEDFYENKHINSDLLTCNLTDLTDRHFYQALGNANKKLITDYYNKLQSSILEEVDDLYVRRNSNFGGFRQT